MEDVFAGEERFVPEGRGFQPEWHREQEFNRLQEAREERRRRDAKKKRPTKKVVNLTKWARHSRMRSGLAKGAGPQAIQKLVSALSSVAEDEHIPGNPDYKPETRKQHDLRDKLIAEAKERSMAVELPVGPLSEAARRSYPEKLEKEVYDALGKWTSASYFTTTPHKLSHYGKIAAKHAVQEALTQLKEGFKENLPKLQAAAIPKHWIKDVFEKASAELYNTRVVPVIQEAGLLMLQRLKNTAVEEGGCKKLEEFVTEGWQNKKCNRNSFGSWADVLFGSLIEAKTKSIRNLCRGEWPQLACILIQEQIEDWVNFAKASSAKIRLSPHDLHVAAKAAKELGPLLGSSFEFFADDLIAASSAQ